MTQESPFNKFLDLIQLDQHIETINRDSKKIEQEMALITAQEYAATVQLNDAKQQVHDAQKKVDEYELEMKTLDAQEQEKKRRLEFVSNHKEYQSLKSEIDLLKKKQNELEDTLIHAWHLLEGAQKAYAVYEQTVHEQATQTRTQLQEKQHAHAELARKQHDQEQIRHEKEQGVPAEWLDKYRMMRARVTDPVVPVVRGACSACFYTVTEQDLVLLRRNKLMQCKDCYRFLYIPNPSTAPAS
ncbi:MAG: zinc ribbon domain-containing protein [Candidatus Babeliales bacterium]